MKQKLHVVGLLVSLIVLLVSTGQSVNRIWVGNKTVSRNLNYVEIHLFIQNDIPLSAIVVPLILETKTGNAFISAAELSFADRLATNLTDYAVTNQYATPDGLCGIYCDTTGLAASGAACDTSRGFHTIAATSGRHDVFASPYGVYFVRARFAGALMPAGTDTVGSLVLKLNIGPDEGTFSIDTTCTDPRNHLAFLDGQAEKITLQFQSGLITVAGNCCGTYTGGFTGNTDCDAAGKLNLADITKLIDRVYVSKLPLCCEPEGNVDGDSGGKLNLADVTKLIDHVYVSHQQTALCR